MENEIIAKIRSDLEENADPENALSAQKFFKEPVKYLGVPTPVVEKISSKYFKEISHLTKDEIFELCEELLKSDLGEEAWIAFDWADKINKQFMPSDIEIFEHWIENYVNSWAKCDTLCNHAVGTFMEMYPQYVQELKKWAHSKNRWFRRAAAVSLILPARKGKYLRDIFQIADILLEDQDDLVQKGYGWVLKAASQSDIQRVFDYVSKNKSKMPRTALRYAIEKMPDNLKDQAMS